MNAIGKGVLSSTGKAALSTTVAGSALNALSQAPDRLTNLLRHRFPTVAITGMSGVGKTRLADRLTGRASSEVTTEIGSAVMERRTSKSAQLKGFRFRVVPGDNAATRLSALDEVFYDEPSDGVIHVVAYGHATPRGTSGAVPSVADQLAAELEDWTITAHRIASMAVRREKPVWLVIAVTKADLYPEQLQEAVRYYSPGSGSPFAEKLDELRALAGSANISIDVLPVSAESNKDMDGLIATLSARMAQLSGHV